MYNILIVDDEEIICRGLKSIIERNNNADINSVEYISNPLMAEEALLRLQPSIIITDIRMPEITGLDLIKNISKLNSDIKFVVLSGYDEFGYVKEAFKLGARDYLLKPVSSDELMDIINKIISNLKEEQQIKLEQQNKTNQYMEAILENKLNKIFSSSKQSEESVNQTFKKLGIVFPYELFRVGALSINQNAGESRNLEDIRKSLDKVSETIIKKHELAVYYLYDINNNFIFIFNHSSKVNVEKLIEYLNMLMNSIKSSMSLESCSSISNAGFGTRSILDCHKQAMEALSYKIVYDACRVIKYSDINDKVDLDETYFKQLEKFKELSDSCNAVDVSNLIDKLFDINNLKHLTIKSISWLYGKVLNKIYEIASEIEIFDLNESSKSFSSFNSISDLKIYIKTLIFELITLHKEKSSEKSISDIAKKYILDNYSKDIDMAVVSNTVSLSYSHFSKIFKDETGMNFSEYLTKVRMEKALEMLSNPVNKVNDISKNVGYNNPKHFTRAFKNHFGFSPSEYRANIPRND